MTRAAGISTVNVQRLWAANDINPYLTRTIKLSNDPHFEEKFWDVIGLYLNPPENHNARLYSPWHFDFVCCIMHLEEKLITTIAKQHRHQDVVDIPQENRTENAKKFGYSSDRRQLRKSQASRIKSLAGQTLQIPHALHANFVFMA